MNLKEEKDYDLGHKLFLFKIPSVSRTGPNICEDLKFSASSLFGSVAAEAAVDNFLISRFIFRPYLGYRG